MGDDALGPAWRTQRCRGDLFPGCNDRGGFRGSLAGSKFETAEGAFRGPREYASAASWCGSTPDAVTGSDDQQSAYPPTRAAKVAPDSPKESARLRACARSRVLGVTAPPLARLPSKATSLLRQPSSLSRLLVPLIRCL